MKNALKTFLIGPSALRNVAGGLLCLAAMSFAAESALAQGELASGTIVGSGAGPYSYSLEFGNAAGATKAIGSIWYAWVPGSFYLPSAPASASAPVGWTATPDGDSVQYQATSSAYYIQPGSSLSGFGYTASFSPAQLAAAPNSGVSYVYSAGFFSDGGERFTVQPGVVPEPSTLALGLPAAAALCLVGLRKSRQPETKKSC